MPYGLWQHSPLLFINSSTVTHSQASSLPYYICQYLGTASNTSVAFLSMTLLCNWEAKFLARRCIWTTLWACCCTQCLSNLTNSFNSTGKIPLNYSRCSFKLLMLCQVALCALQNPPLPNGCFYSLNSTIIGILDHVECEQMHHCSCFLVCIYHSKFNHN